MDADRLQVEIQNIEAAVVLIGAGLALGAIGITCAVLAVFRLVK